MDMEQFSAKAFEENLKIANELLGKVQSGQYSAEQLLREFYEILEKFPLVVESTDILPTTTDAYKNIILQLPYTDLQHSVNFMLDNYKMVVIKNSDLIASIVKKEPKSAKWIFDKVYKILTDQFSANGVDNSTYGLLSILCYGIMRYVQSGQLNYFFDKLFELPEPVLNMLISQFASRLYADFPIARNKIFDFMLNHADTADGLVNLYINLTNIIKIDNSVATTCMNLVEKDLDNPLLNHKSASQMIKLIGFLTDSPEYKDRAAEILKKITAKKSVMSIESLRDAARKLGNTEELRSTVRYGKRVKKTETNTVGYVAVDKISIDEPCVLVLGGDGSNTPKAANGYMKQIESLLQANNIDDTVGIYSVVYSFGDSRTDKKFAFNEYVARKILMRQKGHSLGNDIKSESVDDIDPRYVHQIFETVFLPRISRDGVKLSVDEAIKNIRNITIVAHCHGAYTFLKIEDLMQQKMLELGYKPEECASIQKELLCVAYAPYCPLGVSKSTLISFASARDYDVKHYNQFEAHIRAIIKPDGIGLSWFPDKLGNVFLVPQIYTGEYAEDHNFHGYDLNKTDISEDGRKLIIFEGNAIVNGVKRSMSHTTIPSVKDLVAGGDKELEADFDRAVQNGKFAYEKILERIKLARSQTHTNM